MLWKYIRLHFLVFFLINIFFLNINMAMSQEYLEQVIQRLNAIEQELREVQKRTYTSYDDELKINEGLENINPSIYKSKIKKGKFVKIISKGDYGGKNFLDISMKSEKNRPTHGFKYSFKNRVIN